MTNQIDAATKLQQDIEAYTCGEVPSPLDMLRAPKLENWVTSVRRRGKNFVMVLSGDDTRHPQFEDGDNVHTTSPVMWLDRHARFCRTANRVYALGKPAHDLPDAEG